MEEDNYILDHWTDKACGCKIYHFLLIEEYQDEDESLPYYCDDLVACKLHSGEVDVKLTASDLPNLEKKLKNIQMQIDFIKQLSSFSSSSLVQV